MIFDGVCNLCEASVNFIIDHDGDGVFHFVPSQSPLGQAFEGLLPHQHHPVWTRLS
ncbi:MAG: DCC1-like thiol-disulfide oxidoreductase family protein [Chloroflexota bacterium]